MDKGMSKNLEYLKDYETSQNYEKLWELLNKDYRILTETNRFFHVKNSNTIFSFAYKKYAPKGCYLIWSHQCEKIEDVTKQFFIDKCNEYNLHYIMPKEEQGEWKII